MSAFVDYTFDKGFILDEERIRKLNDILLTRGQQLAGNCKPMYKVYRADTFTYTTEDLRQILSEDNADWQRVVRLAVSLKQDDDFMLDLDFDGNDDKTKLHIEGSDRDFVFVFFSELRQYISNEISVINRRKVRPILAFIAVSILFLMLFWLYSFWGKQTAAAFMTEDTLKSQDINVKLNYIITITADQMDMFSGYPGYALFSMISLACVTFIALLAHEIGLDKPIKRLFPNNIFLIGKEIGRHAKRQSLRQNIMWGIIISSIISVVTGLIVWTITS